MGRGGGGAVVRAMSPAGSRNLFSFQAPTGLRITVTREGEDGEASFTCEPLPYPQYAQSSLPYPSPLPLSLSLTINRDLTTNPRLYKGAELADFVRKNVRMFVTPPLPREGFQTLWELRSWAGLQKQKQRGTIQGPTLDQQLNRRAKILGEFLETLEDDEHLDDESLDELVDWIEKLRNLAAGDAGKVIN